MISNASNPGIAIKSAQEVRIHSPEITMGGGHHLSNLSSLSRFFVPVLMKKEGLELDMLLQSILLMLGSLSVMKVSKG